VQRPRIIDPFLAKIGVDRSDGAVRADVVHERLRALGFTGDERTTRRAVAAAKEAWRTGHRWQYRPWITEPGLWLQFDWGNGPIVFGPDGRTPPPAGSTGTTTGACTARWATSPQPNTSKPHYAALQPQEQPV
jgi:hypothetical protein